MSFDINLGIKSYGFWTVRFIPRFVHWLILLQLWRAPLFLQRSDTSTLTGRLWFGVVIRVGGGWERGKMGVCVCVCWGGVFLGLRGTPRLKRAGALGAAILGKRRDEEEEFASAVDPFRPTVDRSIDTLWAIT